MKDAAKGAEERLADLGNTDQLTISLHHWFVLKTWRRNAEIVFAVAPQPGFSSKCAGLSAPFGAGGLVYYARFLLHAH